MVHFRTTLTVNVNVLNTEMGD